MKHLKIALAFIACGLATSAMATSSSYNLLNNQSSSTGGVGTSGGTAWNNTSSSAYGSGGTNYGNTYSWSSVASGGSTSLTLSAWGTTTASTTSKLAAGWLGDYGSPNGFGVTSQSSGELTGGTYNKNTNPLPNSPDEASPAYQHAMDNYNAYESLLLNFGSAVTLNSVSIGFSAQAAGSSTDQKTDASVFEYIGSGDPTSALTNQSFSSMLCANSAATNCWILVGDLFNMSTSSSVTAGSNSLSGGNYYSNAAEQASKYWMVGAYIAGIGPNSADSSYSAFKVNGVTATTSLVTTQSVPEPGSIALFGLAGAALVINRRRRKS